MSRRFCEYCDQYVRPVPVYQVNHVCQLLGTIVTVGLWLPLWLFACFLSVIQGKECPHCGGKL